MCDNETTLLDEVIGWAENIVDRLSKKFWGAFSDALVSAIKNWKELYFGPEEEDDGYPEAPDQ